MSGGKGGRGQHGGAGSAGRDGKNGSELSAEEFKKQYPDACFIWFRSATRERERILKTHEVLEDKSKGYDYFFTLKSNKGNKVTFSQYAYTFGAVLTLGYYHIRESYCLHEGGPGTPGTPGGDGGKAGSGGQGGYPGKLEIKSLTEVSSHETAESYGITVVEQESEDGKGGNPGAGGKGGLDGRRGWDNGRNEPSNTKRKYVGPGRLHIVEFTEYAPGRVWCWQRQQYVKIQEKKKERSTWQRNGLEGKNEQTKQRQVNRHATKKNAIMTDQLYNEYTAVFRKKSGINFQILSDMVENTQLQNNQLVKTTTQQRIHRMVEHVDEETTDVPSTRTIPQMPSTESTSRGIWEKLLDFIRRLILLRGQKLNLFIPFAIFVLMVLVVDITVGISALFLWLTMVLILKINDYMVEKTLRRKKEGDVQKWKEFKIKTDAEINSENMPADQRVDIMIQHLPEEIPIELQRNLKVFKYICLTGKGTGKAMELFETMIKNFIIFGVKISDSEAQWLLSKVTEERNRLEQFLEVFGGSQQYWMKNKVTMQLADLLGLQQPEDGQLKRLIEGVSQPEQVLTLAMKLDEYKPQPVKNDTSEKAEDDWEMVDKSSDSTNNTPHLEQYGEEFPSDGKEKKVFLLTKSDVTFILELMAQLQLAEEQLNEMYQMDISQWKERLRWIHDVFALKGLPVDWGEEQRLVDSALQLNQLGFHHARQVISSLHECGKTQVTHGNIPPMAILKMLRKATARQWDINDELLNTLKGHWDEWKGNEDKSIRTTEKIAEIMKNDDLNSEYIKNIIQDSTKLKNKSTDFSSHWDEDHVHKFMKNFKEGIPQSSNQHKEHLIENLPKLVSVMNRGIQLKRSFTPRDTQWTSVLLFLLTEDKGLLEQVSTGEGKSLIIIILATIKALYRNKVDIITSSYVLAERDAAENKDIYQLFQINVGHNCSDDTGARKTSYKNNQVVYGEMGMFQRDLLLDRFYDKNIRGDRKFDCIIVDEVDSMILDKGKNVLYLSHDIPGTEYLTPLYVRIWIYAHTRGATGSKENIQQVYEALVNDMHGLVRDIDIKEALEMDSTPSDSALNVKKFLQNENLLGKDGRILKRCEIIDGNYNLPDNLTKEQKGHVRAVLRAAARMEIQLKVPRHLEEFVKRQMESWIYNAFKARSMVEGDHYFIGHDSSEFGQADGPNIIIMDKDTGTEQYSSQWNNGLHQFLQLKHGCAIGYESLKAVFMSNIRYLKEYGSSIYGLTGTLGSNSERELLTQLYNVDFANLPTFKPSQFVEDFAYVCKAKDDQKEKLREVADDMVKEDGRPVLIIAENIRDVNALRKAFDDVLPREDGGYDVHTYKHSYDKLDVFHAEEGLQEPCVILATNLAGRGSDLKISEEINRAGGLHVILTYLPNNKRIEEQAFGRAARKGQNGSGQLIIVGSQNESSVAKLKVRRDEMECKRIGEIHQHYQTHIKAEETLFDEITKEIKKVKTKTFATVKTKLLAFPADKRRMKVKKEVFMESCLYKWALWLDSMKTLLEKASNTEKDQRELREKFKILLDSLKGSKDFHQTVTCPALKLKLAKVYVEEKHEQTTELFDELIQSDPDFAEGAHYYKAHWLIKSEKGKGKDAVFHELEEAAGLFKSRISDNASNIGLVKQISDHYTRDKTESFIPTKGFEDQMNQMNEMYQMFMSSIDAIIGQSVSETLLLGLTISPQVDQTDNVTETQDEAPSEENSKQEILPKTPGDSYQACILHNALLQHNILEPSRFTSKSRALSADVEKKLRSQYGFDAVDIREKLKTLLDGQVVKDEDFRNVVANAEDFWECVTDEKRREDYILVNKESLSNKNFSNPDIPSALKDQSTPLVQPEDILNHSADEQYIYLIPPNVNRQQIKENKFLVYRKDDLKVYEMKFLKDCNLYTEVRVGKLKKNLESNPLQRYDSMEVEDLKMIEGLTDEEARHIFQQLIDMGFISSSTPARLIQTDLEVLGGMQLPDYPEYREEVIEIIFHCFKYRFALAVSAAVPNEDYNGEGEEEIVNEEDKGKDEEGDSQQQPLVRRTVPDFMEHEPHVGIFKNLVEMEVITPVKIQENVTKEEHLTTLLDTFHHRRSKTDYPIITEDEILRMIPDGEMVKKLLEEMKRQDLIKRQESGKIYEISVSADVVKCTELSTDELLDGLVKNLLLSKISLMPLKNQIRDSILSWQSEFLKIENPDSYLVSLGKKFNQEDISNKIKTILLFEGAGLDSIITMQEEKWTRNAVLKMIAIAVLGVIQIGIGVVLEHMSFGILTPLGTMLISEGIGDILFAMQCAWRGHCTWRDYAKHKAVSVLISVATFGLGAVFSRGAQLATPVASIIARRIVREVAQAVAIGVASRFMDQTAENTLSHYVRVIAERVKKSARKKVQEHKVTKKLTRLIQHVGAEQGKLIMNRISDTTLPPDALSRLVEQIDYSDSFSQNLSRHPNASVKLLGIIARFLGKLLKGTLLTAQTVAISDAFLDALNPILDEELQKYEGQELTDTVNEELKEEVAAQLEGMITKRIDQKLTSKVYSPIRQYCVNQTAAKYREEIDSAYQKSRLRQRRIFDSTLEEYNEEIEKQAKMSGDDDDNQPKKSKRPKTKQSVENAIRAKFYKSLVNLANQTQNAELLADIRDQDMDSSTSCVDPDRNNTQESVPANMADNTDQVETTQTKGGSKEDLEDKDGPTSGGGAATDLTEVHPDEEDPRSSTERLLEEETRSAVLPGRGVSELRHRTTQREASEQIETAEAKGLIVLEYCRVRDKDKAFEISSHDKDELVSGRDVVTSLTEVKPGEAYPRPATKRSLEVETRSADLPGSGSTDLRRRTTPREASEGPQD